MLINTRDFGEINIFEKEIINFSEGIFAFEDSHKFVLIAPCGENKYPMWLQSIDNSSLCFIVYNPLEFVDDYSVSIDLDTKKILEINKDTEVDFLVIAVIPQDYEDTTVNLKSPIVVNSATSIAAQIIAAEQYPIRFPIFKKEEI